MSLKKYHIKKENGEWKATIQGGSKAAIVTNTLDQMQSAVKKLNPNGDGVSAIYHTSKGENKGKIREERTYPKSKDPKSSKG